MRLATAANRAELSRYQCDGAQRTAGSPLDLHRQRDDERAARGKLIEVGQILESRDVLRRGDPVHTQLVDVRVGEHDGYDRVVFEFDNGIPEYVVSQAEAPYTEDPSGLPIEVEGASVLQLVMIGATRFDEDYEAMNQVYAEYFTRPAPARSTIQAAALPKNARVEIDVIAVLDSRS